MEIGFFFISLLLYIPLTWMVGDVFVIQVFKIGSIKTSNATKLLTGHLTITSIYAVLSTQGYTYLIVPLMVILGMYAFSFINSGSVFPVWKEKKVTVRNISLILVLALGAFCSLYFRIFDWGDGLKKIHTDFSFYGGVADFLKKYRVETLILDPLAVTRFPYQPYHYFELWSAGLFSSVLSVPALKTLMLVVYPYHIFLILTAIYEITKTLVRSWIDIIIIILISLFLTPLGSLFSDIIDLVAPIKVPLVSEHGIQTKMGMKLYAVQALFVVYIFHILKEEKWSIRLMLLLGTLLAVYPTTLPFGGLFLLSVWLYKSKVVPRFFSSVSKKYYFAFLGLLFLTIGIVSISTAGIKATLSALFTPIKYLLSFAYFLLLFLLMPKQRKVLSLPIMSLLLFSLFFHLLINIGQTYFPIFNDPNFGQIIANFADPVFLMLSIYITLVFTFQNHTPIKLGIAGIILVLYFFQGHDRAYKRGAMNDLVDKETLLLLNQNSEEVIAYQRDSIDFENTTVSWSIYYDIPYHNLRWYTDHYFPICISLPTVSFDTKITDDSKKQWLNSIIKRSSFYQFSNSENDSFPDNINDKTAEFLELNQVKKVIYSKER